MFFGSHQPRQCCVTLTCKLTATPLRAFSCDVPLLSFRFIRRPSPASNRLKEGAGGPAR